MTGPGGNELDTDDIETMFFGNQEAEALYLGRMLVWEASKQDIWMPFNSGLGEHLGRYAPAVTNSDGVTHLGDHANFPTTSSRLSFSHSSPWTNGFSIAFWMRTTPGLSGWSTIAELKQNASTPGSVWIAHSLAGPGDMGVGIRVAGTAHERFSTRTVQTGSWTHFALIVNRISSSNTRLRMFLNGTASGDFTLSLPLNNFPTLIHHIGSTTTGEVGWSGYLDDYMVWDEPTTPEEILQIYQQGRSIVPLITTPSLSEMSINQYYYFTLGTNFTATSWSATGLPAGVSISNVGVISGTPTSTGSGSTTITASGEGGQTASKTFSWSVVDIPVLPIESIRANGANKTSHSGWARPNVTWTVNSGSPQYASNGTLNMRHGRGRVIASATLNSARAGRIVSNLNGTIAISSSSTGWEISTGSRVFQAGEQIYLELNGYSGSTSDRFGLYVEP